MQFGVCGGPEIADKAATAGFDFFEWSVGALLHPLDDKSAFSDSLGQIRRVALPCPVVNCFVPAALKITGPNADFPSLKRYVATAFQRAQRVGVKVVVFGSGGARRIPDDFDRIAAYEQIVTFSRMCAAVAHENGVTIAVEPLNKTECNVLNTVAEAADLVREVNHPALRLLVDGYHWMKDGDSAADIAANGSLLAHVHVATALNRLAPGAEECDLSVFFTALKKAGYDGRVSIEGGIPNPETDLPKALEIMKSLV